MSALLLSTLKWTGYGFIFINIQTEVDGLRIITNMQMEMEIPYRHQHYNGGGWCPPLLLTFTWSGGPLLPCTFKWRGLPRNCYQHANGMWTVVFRNPFTWYHVDAFVWKSHRRNVAWTVWFWTPYVRTLYAWFCLEILSYGFHPYGFVWKSFYMDAIRAVSETVWAMMRSWWHDELTKGPVRCKCERDSALSNLNFFFSRPPGGRVQSLQSIVFTTFAEP